MLDKKIRVVSQKEFDYDLNENELIDTPDAFFEEINAIDMLEQSENPNTIGLLCSKVAFGGKLILNGIDTVNLCGRIFYGKVPLDHAAISLRDTKNFFSMTTILQYLINNKWQINFTGIKECRYIIEATRA